VLDALPPLEPKRKEDELRRIVLSLFILVTIITMPPPAAWADSIVNWSAGGWALNTSTSAGSGNAYWNGLEVQFNGGSFLFGSASSSLWTFSASNTQIRGTGPASWNSTLGLTFIMLPNSTPFKIDVFQFKNGVLLTGETSELTWNGYLWTTASRPNVTPVPEPTTLALLAMSVLTGAVLRKKLC